MEAKKEEPILSQEEQIDIIQRQTTYTKEECIQYLQSNNNDYISVIKQYMGIPTNKQDESQKRVNANRVNQERYKQIRNIIGIQRAPISEE
jgi:hypothetical protein